MIVGMTTMTLPNTARIASTKLDVDRPYDVLTAALRGLTCDCGDCAAYILRGALKPGEAQAPSTTLLALAKRSLVVLDKSGARIVGAYVTDLGRRVQAETAWRMAYAERTARIVHGRP
jgi:hypothetical protein